MGGHVNRTSLVVIGIVIAVLVVLTIILARSGSPVRNAGVQGVVSALA